MGWLTTNTIVALTMAYTYYPVLKHGSRSASELRVFWCENQSMRNESKWIPMAARGYAVSAGPNFFEGSERN
jgi:hypothetical protein